MQRKPGCQCSIDQDGILTRESVTNDHRLEHEGHCRRSAHSPGDGEVCRVDPELGKIIRQYDSAAVDQVSRDHPYRIRWEVAEHTNPATGQQSFDLSFETSTPGDSLRDKHGDVLSHKRDPRHRPSIGDVRPLDLADDALQVARSVPDGDQRGHEGSCRGANRPREPKADLHGCRCCAGERDPLHPSAFEYRGHIVHT